MKWLKTPHNTLVSECGSFSITKALPEGLYPKPYALWRTPGGRVDNFSDSKAAKAAAISIAPSKSDAVNFTSTNRGVTHEHPAQN
jgi:hypothetical protein